jgi:hypothetical protein
VSLLFGSGWAEDRKEATSAVVSQPGRQRYDCRQMNYVKTRSDLQTDDYSVQLMTLYAVRNVAERQVLQTFRQEGKQLGMLAAGRQKEVDISGS